MIRPLGSLVTSPTLVQYDEWGRRVDLLKTSEGWRKLKEISQREGIPGIFYERTHQEHSRVYGYSKVFMMTADMHEVRCLGYFREADLTRRERYSAPSA